MNKKRWKKRSLKETVDLLCQQKGGMFLRAGATNQTYIASISSTSQGTVSRWMNDEHSPKIENIKPLAHAFGVSVSQLIGDEPIPKVDAEATLSDYLRSRIMGFSTEQLVKLEGYIDGLLSEQESRADKE